MRLAILKYLQLLSMLLKGSDLALHTRPHKLRRSLHLSFRFAFIPLQFSDVPRVILTPKICFSVSNIEQPWNEASAYTQYIVCPGSGTTNLIVGLRSDVTYIDRHY